MDKRHQARVEIVQQIFAHDFAPQNADSIKLLDKSHAIVANIEMIDTLIKDAAPKFPIEKIAKVDLAVLRLAVYEIAIEKKIPPKVSINEAIELAKEMGGEKSPAFVNAVLGKIYNK